MIKAPSSQKTYDAFYTGDPAIVSLPAEASDEQRADRDRAIERALETGDWSAVVVPGEQPTRFVMKPLGAEVFGELQSMLGTVRSYVMSTLAFRAAIVDVKNLPDAGAIDFVIHPTLGRIATTAFLDRAGLTGELGAAIITQLGWHAYLKAQGSNPKS